MNFENILISAVGTIQDGTIFRRKDVYDYLIKLGYAERSATNAVTPSRKGGLINALLVNGAIEPHGPLAYRIVDRSKIMKKVGPTTRCGKAILYAGSPRDDYTPLGVMSDEDKHKVDWLLCGDRYAEGCWNLKLYADGKVPHKANYWLQFRNGKLFGSDAPTLLEHHPDLYENIISDMTEMES